MAGIEETSLVDRIDRFRKMRNTQRDGWYMKWYVLAVLGAISPTLVQAINLPDIVVQPKSIYSSGMLSVICSNATAYQWRCNGVDIPGATNASLWRSGSDPTGYYMVVVKNDAGWVPSQLAYLARGSGGLVPFSNVGNSGSFALACYDYVLGMGQVGQPLATGLAQVNAGPEVDQMAPVGEAWDFSWGEPGYFDDYDQWVPTVSPGQTVYYQVNLSYPYGGGTYIQPSRTLALVAGGGSFPTPSSTDLKFPIWIEWPEPTWFGGGSATNLVILPGETITLAENYGACGDFGMLTYQWRKDGQPIPGQTNGVFYAYPYCGSANTTLALTNVQAADAGVYDIVVRGNRFICEPKIALSVQFLGGSGVFQSPRIDGANFTCDLTGATGRRYQIQWSTNLITWNVLTTVTNANGVVSFSSPRMPTAARFYRSDLLPP
jgi:hypothetical protein